MNSSLFSQCVKALESVDRIEDAKTWLKEALRNPGAGHGFNMARSAGIQLADVTKLSIKAVLSNTVKEGDTARVQAGNIFMEAILEYIGSQDTQPEELEVRLEDLDSE